MAFALNFLDEKVFEQRINELLATWDANATFKFRTSGSTGVPKEISFEKNQLEISIKSTIQSLGLEVGKEHIFLCLDPNFIAGAMMLLRAKYLDCPITVCLPSASFWQKIPENHNFSFVSLVPPQIADERFDVEKFATFKHVLIGGMSLSSSLKNKIIGLGNNVYHSYGMTETLTHVALMDVNQSCYYIAIEGNAISLTKQGSLAIKTAFSPVEIITTDQAVFNNQGGFSILGRTDFVINTGGHKVHPESIEAAIADSFERAYECMGYYIVCGKKDDVYGEQIWLVTEKEMKDEDFEELQQVLRQVLKGYEIPRGKIAFGAFPLTVSGKVARNEIFKRLIYS